jgi:hypothetical protein
MLVQSASLTLGAVVGLIAAAIFAVILRRVEKSKPRDAIISLYNLIALTLGGGIADYAIFDRILLAGAIFFYVIGYGVAFLPFGLIIFIDWLRRR